MLTAIVLRMPDIFCRRTGPQASWSSTPSGSAAAGAPCGTRRRGGVLAHRGLDVVLGDPAVRAAAGDHAPDRRPARAPGGAWRDRPAASCRRRLARPRGLRRRGSALGGGAALAAAARLRLAARRGFGFVGGLRRLGARLGWRLLGGLAAGCLASAAALGRRALGRCAGRAFERQQRIADFDLRPLLDVDLGDRGRRCGQGSSTTALPVSISITLCRPGSRPLP